MGKKRGGLDFKNEAANPSSHRKHSPRNSIYARFKQPNKEPLAREGI